jgi:diguanylate cyclase (GGDEF)-like protein/PAS domain S-box-containing protein
VARPAARPAQDSSARGRQIDSPLAEDKRLQPALESDGVTAEEHYRDLFENASDIFYTYDLEGNITSFNKAAQAASGYSHEEALKLNIRQLLEPDSFALTLEMIRQMLGGAPRAAFEATIVTKNRHQIALEVSSRLLFRRGSPVGVQGIARDVTERRRAEILERDRYQVLELVAANAPLESVLSRVCRLVEGQCPEVLCSIHMNRNGRLVPGSPPDGPPAPAEALEWLRAEAAGSLTDWYVLPAADVKACWLVPIRSGEHRVLGAFLLFCREDHDPDSRRRAVLDTAGQLAAVAIEHSQLTDQLAYQARHDALTGLPNRLLFEEKLAGVLDEARCHNWMLAVLFLDLDRFKQINDTLGHPTGDMVLEQVSRRLEQCLRKGDVLARLGGDEFTLLLTGLSDTRDALHVATKLLEALRYPFNVEGHELFLTASIGISMYPRDGSDSSTLQRNADAAMYRAKNRGKDGIEFYTGEMGSAALERLEIETALRRALENQEFQLYYQPQADMSGKLTGLEALLVWRHPRLGLIPPAQFIPVAEDSGMIVPIGVWALAEACRQNAKWQRDGQAGVRVAVNVSPMQFDRSDFVDTVAQTLAQSGLPPSLLELELTENVVMRDLDESARQMGRLRALGVSISIDDFGTGYSSLSYLRRLPLDTLKTDQSFLREIDKDVNTIPLLGAVVALAHSLGLTVVAEGVETQQQLEALRGVGCDRFQGYLLGEPLTAEAAEHLLAETLYCGSRLKE